MRRIARLERPINLLQTRSIQQTQSHYLCAVCKRRSTPFSTSAVQGAKVSLTEKVRRKIWGTDQPPGQEDPYSNVSAFDQSRTKALKEAAQEVAAQRAARKEAAVLDSSYEPSSTWDGLQFVGGFEDWWKNNWDPEHKFNGFLPKQVMKNGNEIAAAVHRSVVEITALKQAGLPLDILTGAAPGDDLTTGIEISLSATGNPQLQFPESVSLQDIIQSLAPVETEEFVAESPETLEADGSVEDPLQSTHISKQQSPNQTDGDAAPETATENPMNQSSTQTYHDIVTAWSPSWLQVSLNDPEVKFAVMKRTTQLTGLCFPDAALKSTNTVQSLLSHLIKPPKPRKLKEALQQKEELVKLPNVAVSGKRITPIHKEKQVGRWKIIQKELEERGLPITGR